MGMKWRRNKKKKTDDNVNMILLQLFMCIWGSESYFWSSLRAFLTLSFIVLRIFLQRAFPLFYIPSNDFRFRSNQWLHVNIQWPWTFQASTFASTFALHNINLKWVASMKTRYKFNQTKRWNVKMTMERTGFSCSIVGTFVYLMYLPAPIHARFIS